jgi:ATP-dependent DNA helicase RecG
MDLNTKISELGKVGKKVAKLFGSLGVKNVKDLLYYFPFRYEDYRQIVSVAELKEGELVTVCVQVELVANKRSFKSRRMITEALVSDKSGSVRVKWFNQPYIIKNIKTGDVIYLSGKVKSDMLGPQLVSPLYEKYKKETTHTARLVPIYPLTKSLTQKQVRFLMNEVVGLLDKIEDWLPKNILEFADLTPLANALRGIHFPTDEHELKLSEDRLKFDELFLVQMKAELAKKGKELLRAPTIIFQEEKIKQFVASLPFTLTKSQKVSAWEILQDMNKNSPMNRLVSGDVGSGKTVVAAMAMYNVFLNDFQAVIMAPTEILAFQHYQSLVKLYKGLSITVALLTGNQMQINNQVESEKINKKVFLEQIKNGAINIIVGTHALLSDNVSFKKLGLVVVDEQHRFGVEQRKLIKTKGTGAHFLSMTATPIPRSLALMIYGDLDVSIINELPPGRKTIITKLVEPIKRDKAYQFIREQVKQGRQVFVICPLIESADLEGQTLMFGATDKKSVLSEYEKLSKQTFPDLRVGFLHGKLKPKEKDEVMGKFKNGEIDLLVSTSVVEVGVDIPNASVMMIEGAESFGLAQLHQFRGRVGRSVHQSYCLLFTSSDSVKSMERLKFFEQHNDGFQLAEKDLEVRGPGEVYGTEQSGEIGLRLAKLTDRELIKKAREGAKIAMENIKDNPKLLARVKDWKKETHLE